VPVNIFAGVPKPSLERLGYEGLWVSMYRGLKPAAWLRGFASAGSYSHC
jgi:hypothetical protein